MVNKKYQIQNQTCYVQNYVPTFFQQLTGIHAPGQALLYVISQELTYSLTPPMGMFVFFLL